MNVQHLSPQYHVNDNGSINLPFGHAIEAYINTLPLLKNCKLRKQSRLCVNENIKSGLITIKRVEGAIDYLVWKTIQGQSKSTNRLDDIIELTDKGRKRVTKIMQGLAPDLTVWRWVLFCDGNSGCESACGGIGELRIITKVMLSNVEEPFPMQLFIEGAHRSPYIPAVTEQKSKRINLSLETRDKAIAARHAHRSTGMELAMEILAPYNNLNENQLNYAHKNNKDLCIEQQLKRLVERDDNRLRDNIGPWTILDQLINSELKNQGKVLYYQRYYSSAPENSPECYYKLTVSDEMWLQQGRDCGYFCFGIDGKYDLNNEKVPVLAIVIEDQAGYGSLLAFGLSDKENHHTIKMAVQAVQANIPSMIDKHCPTQLTLQGLIRGTILCCFHIMAMLGEHLQTWKVDSSLRYPIALAFKIVGQSKLDEEAYIMEKEYEQFIYSLPLNDNTKNLLVSDLKTNWICDEWKQCFIDGGRAPQPELGEIIFNAGLSTYWNMRTTEHKQMLPKKPIDMKRRINQGRLYVLLNLVRPVIGHNNYMFVEKRCKRFYSPYNYYSVGMLPEISEKIDAMITKLVYRDNISIPSNCYLDNMSSGECTCYDYIRNGSYRDVCKHVHAARLYVELLNQKLQINELSKSLVKHFKNKEHTIAPERKNDIINNGTEDKTYQEILRLFNIVGNDIFFPVDRKTFTKDPFRPTNNVPIPTTVGSPKNYGAKCRKPSRFSNYNELSDEIVSNESNESIEKSKTFDNTITIANDLNDSIQYLQDYNSNDNLRAEHFDTSNNMDASESSINISHSILCRNTTRIRNKRRGSAKTLQVSGDGKENNGTLAAKRSLEELFLEKECNWNPKEFTNAALAKKLCLDNNSAKNGVKLYRWISNRKIRAKNA
ncbi:hypothetical protein C2G38_2242639 [Gigaspora rosea]|uniref:SWIM-type domain-containing protein n=1 Tax=Gigaspora rosea TaxID=44941 RepID=A0A397VM36_9GLOM|nr:hypothetical protein C2G38_2242639 [Gigaspora rosea]